MVGRAGDETSTGGPQKGFKPTLWTTVLRAKNPKAVDRKQALEQLIHAYWKPTYFFIRRRGHDVESAKDLTQAFFSEFLEKDFLKSVDRSRGRFRSFILAAVTHFLSNQYDRSRAKKRGGDFNFVDAEREIPSSDASPEETFFNAWALETMERAMARLHSESTPEDMSLLAGVAPAGMPEHEQKNRRHRLRLRLRGLLRQEVLPSVENEGEADEELRELLSRSSRRI